MKNYSQKKDRIIIRDNDKTTEQNTIVLTPRQQHIAQRDDISLPWKRGVAQVVVEIVVIVAVVNE